MIGKSEKVYISASWEYLFWLSEACFAFNFHALQEENPDLIFILTQNILNIQYL